MNGVSLPTARVSMQMTGTLLTGTLNSTQSELLQVQQQLSTGNALSQASDNPAAASQILRLKQQLAGNVQYTSNLNFAGSFLATADNALGSVSGLVNQATSIASSQVGTGSTPDQRAAQAQVVQSLITQLMSVANTKYQGQAVFAGSKTGGDAFVAAGSGYQYAGNNAAQQTLTENGGAINYTVDGSGIFGGSTAQVTGAATLSPALTANTRLADLGGATGRGVAPGTVDVTVGATTVNVDLSKAATVGDVVSLTNAALTAAGSTASVGISGGALAVNGDATQAVTVADTGSGTTAADLGIVGTTAAAGTSTGTNLGARVTATTPLSALNGGAGVSAAGLVLSNGTTTKTVAMAGLTTVGDLLNAINGAGVNAQAQINAAGTGINVINGVSGAGLTIGENGGTTASDLGIRSFSGTTALSGLNNGGGVGLASSANQGPTGQIVVTKTDGTTFNVTMDGIKTPTQLIAAINGAAGNTTVTAAMNAAGNGITLTDTSGGGGNLTVGGAANFVSNGSTLGIFQVGTGGTLTGTPMTFSTDDFRVTRHDGSSFTVNVTGATTVQDVINAINGADGNTNPVTQVTAALNANGNGISLTDASTGGGTLSVTAVNGSTAASDLGIAGSASGATLSGTDANPVQPTGLFTALSMLRDALAGNDTAGINRAAALLGTGGSAATAARGVVGAREQDISARKTAASDENTSISSAISLLSDTDMTTAITKFQQLQTAYQAALQTAETTRNLSLLDFLSS